MSAPRPSTGHPFWCPALQVVECRPDPRFRCVWCGRWIVGAIDWQQCLLDALFARSMRLAAEWWLALAVENEQGPPMWLRDVVSDVCSDPMAPDLCLPFHERADECLRLALFCEAHAFEAEQRCGWH